MFNFVKGSGQMFPFALTSDKQSSNTAAVGKNAVVDIGDLGPNSQKILR